MMKGSVAEVRNGIDGIRLNLLFDRGSVVMSQDRGMEKIVRTFEADPTLQGVGEGLELEAMQIGSG